MFTRHPAAAVLFDRDGTLIENVPDNTDPSQVRPAPGAQEALTRMRRAGVQVAVLTNQPGVARGRVSPDELHEVNARVEELLGPFDAWAICVHAEGDGCGCRRPAPGLVLRVADTLHVSPFDCVVIGDIGSDMAAARAAGARGILVPTRQTRREEVEAAREVAGSLTDAVDRVDPLDYGATLTRRSFTGLMDQAQVVGWSRW